MGNAIDRLRAFFSKTTATRGDAPDLPSANDLARVVTKCNCPGSPPPGWIGTVERLLPSVDFRCSLCGFECECDAAFIPDFAKKRLAPGRVFTGYIPRHWLRRIPPLSELESVDICDELDAERPRERVTA